MRRFGHTLHKPAVSNVPLFFILAFCLHRFKNIMTRKVDKGNFQEIKLSVQMDSKHGLFELDKLTSKGIQVHSIS